MTATETRASRLRELLDQAREARSNAEANLDLMTQDRDRVAAALDETERTALWLSTERDSLAARLSDLQNILDAESEQTDRAVAERDELREQVERLQVRLAARERELASMTLAHQDQVSRVGLLARNGRIMADTLGKIDALADEAARAVLAEPEREPCTCDTCVMVRAGGDPEVGG